MKRKSILVISGLDPTGAAGIMADIRALAYSGVRTATIVTAITVQGQKQFKRFEPVNADIVMDQINLLCNDYEFDAIKIGMLGSVEIVKKLDEFFTENEWKKPIILDPIWRSTSGGIIATEDVRDAIVENLCHHIHVITPNVQELKWLTSVQKLHSQWIDKSARKLIDRGCKSVLVKGGDTKGHPTDILFTKMKKIKYSAARLDGTVRGTGCHMASFLTAQIADGKPLDESVRRSKNYVRKLFHNYSTAGNNILPAWRPLRPKKT